MTFDEFANALTEVYNSDAIKKYHTDAGVYMFWNELVKKLKTIAPKTHKGIFKQERPSATVTTTVDKDGNTVSTIVQPAVVASVKRTPKPKIEGLKKPLHAKQKCINEQFKGLKIVDNGTERAMKPSEKQAYYEEWIKDANNQKLFEQYEQQYNTEFATYVHRQKTENELKDNPDYAFSETTGEYVLVKKKKSPSSQPVAQIPPSVVNAVSATVSDEETEETPAVAPVPVAQIEAKVKSTGVKVSKTATGAS